MPTFPLIKELPVAPVINDIQMRIKQRRVITRQHADALLDVVTDYHNGCERAFGHIEDVLAELDALPTTDPQAFERITAKLGWAQELLLPARITA